MKTRAVLAAAILAVLAAAPAGAFNFGSIGDVLDKAHSAVRVGQAAGKAAQDITPEQEYYLGRAVAATILGKYRPYDNPTVNRYLTMIGQGLAAGAGVPATFGGYHFLALDSDEVNGFAAPGGHILVTRGLLRLCQGEDDLAGVLAHEMAHVQLRHGVKSIESSRLNNLGAVLLKEGARQAGGHVGELVGIFEGTIGDVVQKLMVGGYSRDQEREADRTAVETIKRTGYDTYGLMNVLAGMNQLFKTDRRGFAATHPARPSRKPSRRT